MADDNPFDMIARGQRGNNLLGSAIFIGLRAADPFLQRQLLLNSPLPALARILGLRPPRPPPTGGLPLAGSGMTPYQTLLWAFSIGSAAKHILWITVLGNEPTGPAAAVAIGLFNTTFNTLNTLAFNLAGENPTFFPPWSVWVGTALYVTGILVETVGEIQRGLFSVVRHASYLGYTMWRTGYATASGGPVLGAAVAAFFISTFANRSVPALDNYMSKKYGEQWARVKRNVPYALIPGVW
ncbi:hypothetical protein LTR10_013745 [Elasticomyces elasticus]|uniref:Steroid 5-alpha reductase C-terminal domain-containing protein n=1 Tax=Exophiala sideris TaxID=1016849 RepID=A0ABR0JGH7_9EURO|nr:hypothetical protein LTR10_013745 [Elasticomyces elasticus]KAK5033279.1 hypothetical protein LTS07_003581 [Exophiala sideris]KAK5042224.1 hypothetical protein LTR13_002030 [Exophiala sideris]KAK5063823.1 hypothetical protein LTR69_003589 [Exophiala sideris]KAK5185492.1 hypothetical protein LTR44_002481 [Eurotiomycetes sp. CCFEE 6388]